MGSQFEKSYMHKQMSNWGRLALQVQMWFAKVCQQDLNVTMKWHATLYCALFVFPDGILQW